jgi:hypothetical protein
MRGDDMFEFEKTININSLKLAWRSVRARKGAPGIDCVNVDAYEKNIDENLRRLNFALKNDMYKPYNEIRTHFKDRDIFISCVEDKIVQTAIASILQQCFVFPICVHSFIKNRSIYTAQSAVKKSFRTFSDEHTIKTEILKYYRSIDRQILLNTISAYIRDRQFMKLLKLSMRTASSGISTGSCLSPVLSNIYLKDFDEEISCLLPLYTRYADDMLIIVPNSKTPDAVLDTVNSRLVNLKLELNKTKTHIYKPEEPVQYLGFEFEKITGNRDAGIESMLTKKQFMLADAALNAEHTPSNTIDPETNIFDAKIYNELFIHRNSSLWITSERGRYADKIDNSRTELFVDLIENEKEFAADVLMSNGMTTFTIFDIDVDRKIILEHGDDTGIFKTLVEKTKDVAFDVANKLKSAGVHPYIEFSGYKGYHVWVFWSSELTINSLKKFYSSILSDIVLPEGIHIEIFPSGATSAQKIKLPFSTHCISGVKSYFIDEECSSIGENQLPDISKSNFNTIAARPLTKTHIPENMSTPTISSCAKKQKQTMTDTDKYAETPSYVLAVRSGCGIIDAIVTKAHKEHYLMTDSPGCYRPPKKEEKMGHFKSGSATSRINELIFRYAEITRKNAELRNQETICIEQLDLLFEKHNISEANTDLGKVVKRDDEYYLKLG